MLESLGHGRLYSRSSDQKIKFALYAKITLMLPASALPSSPLESPEPLTYAPSLSHPKSSRLVLPSSLRSKMLIMPLLIFLIFRLRRVHTPAQSPLRLQSLIPFVPGEAGEDCLDQDALVLLLGFLYVESRKVQKGVGRGLLVRRGCWHSLPFWIFVVSGGVKGIYSHVQRSSGWIILLFVVVSVLLTGCGRM